MAWSLVREVTSPALPATAVTHNIALGANASSVAVGNLLVLDLATITPTVSGTPTSTTATAGALGPWTLGINVAGGGTTQITAVYFAVVKGPLISTDTINVTFTATAQPVILVTEFSAGFTIGTATLDKSTSSGAFGSTAFNSGTTAALAGASDLILGSVTFDDGTGTNTITPAVLSPAWQAPPTTTVKTGPGSMRHSFRWRDPAASTAVAFTGTVSGTGPDWGAAVVAVTATPASAATAVSPLLRMLVQGGLQRAKALLLIHPPVPAAAPALTAVSDTRAIVYDLLEDNSATRAIKYDLFQSTSATRGVKYDLVASTASTRGIKYDLTATTASTRAIVYDLAAATTTVSATRGIKYDLLAVTSGTRGIRYDLIASTSATRGIRYDLQAVMSATRGVRYDLVASTAATRAIKYDLLATTSATRAIKYDLVGTTTSTRAIVYDLGPVIVSPRTRSMTWVGQ